MGGMERKKADHLYATPPTSSVGHPPILEAADEAVSNVSRDHSYIGTSAGLVTNSIIFC